MEIFIMLNKELQSVLSQFGLRRVCGGDFEWKDPNHGYVTCWDGVYGGHFYCHLHDQIRANRWIKTSISFAIDKIRSMYVQPMSQWDVESNQEIEDSIRVLKDLMAL
jgi:hypothetical protein